MEIKQISIDKNEIILIPGNDSKQRYIKIELSARTQTALEASFNVAQMQMPEWVLTVYSTLRVKIGSEEFST